MKKMNLSVTKCTNKKCGYKIIAEVKMDKCPLCRAKMFKDKAQTAEGLLDEQVIVLKNNRRKK